MQNPGFCSGVFLSGKTKPSSVHKSRKNEVLVVQAQEGVDQEVNHPILPVGAFVQEERRPRRS